MCLEELEGTGRIISEPEYPAWQQRTGIQSMYEISPPVWDRDLDYDETARSAVDMV